MPKLRNADTDVGKFAQWMGRKIKHHAPLAELGLASSQREELHSTYREKSGRGRMAKAVEGDESLIICQEAGRVFRIKVEEISEADIEGLELVDFSA